MKGGKGYSSGSFVKGKRNDKGRCGFPAVHPFYRAFLAVRAPIFTLFLFLFLFLLSFLLSFFFFSFRLVPSRGHECCPCRGATSTARVRLICSVPAWRQVPARQQVPVRRQVPARRRILTPRRDLLPRQDLIRSDPAPGPVAAPDVAPGPDAAPRPVATLGP